MTSTFERASAEPAADLAKWLRQEASFWRDDAFENAALICERYEAVDAARDIRQLKGSTQPPSDDAIDAARWRALIGCGRVRVLGSAGIYRRGPNGYAHIGVEFWTHHEFQSDPSAIDDLTNFATLAAEARATATKEGSP